MYLRLPALVVKCTAHLFRMAPDEEVTATMPLLLAAAEAVCPAALEQFWSFEQHWQGVQAPSDIQRSLLLQHIDSLWPLFDQVQQLNVGAVEHVNAKLAAALAADNDKQTLQPQRQQEPREGPVAAGLLSVNVEGGSHTSVSARTKAQAVDTVDEMLWGLLKHMWEEWASDMQDCESTCVLGCVSEGKRLLAAVQDLKAEVRKMSRKTQRRREEEERKAELFGRLAQR